MFFLSLQSGMTTASSAVAAGWAASIRKVPRPASKERAHSTSSSSTAAATGTDATPPQHPCHTHGWPSSSSSSPFASSTQHTETTSSSWFGRKRSRPLEMQQPEQYTSSLAAFKIGNELPPPTLFWHNVVRLQESQKQSFKTKHLFRTSLFQCNSRNIIWRTFAFSRLTDEMSPFLFPNVLQNYKTVDRSLLSKVDPVWLRNIATVSCLDTIQVRDCPKSWNFERMTGGDRLFSNGNRQNTASI